MTDYSELEPCPYCGGHASLSKIGRDWYRIAADHVTGCPLEDFQLDCPQSDDQLPLLLHDWNTRVDRSPSNNAEREKIKDEIETLRIDAERLNWLDGRSRPVVEGQCMANPEGELTGYDWGVFGQCSTVREAIDYAMSVEEKP